MTLDTWHMTCDTGSVTHDMWQCTMLLTLHSFTLKLCSATIDLKRSSAVGEGEPSLKISAPYFFRFCSEGVRNIFSQWVTNWLIYASVHRTDPVLPGIWILFESLDQIVLFVFGIRIISIPNSNNLVFGIRFILAPLIVIGFSNTGPNICPNSFTNFFI